MDALQVVAGQVLHGGPVLGLQGFNVAAENIVGRQQQKGDEKQQHRRRQRHLPQLEEQVDGRQKAVKQAGQVLAVVDLHGLHSVHGGGDGGHWADFLHVTHIQLQHFGENPSTERLPGLCGAAVLGLAGKQLQQEHDYSRQQGGHNRSGPISGRHGWGCHIAQKPGDDPGKGGKAHQHGQL